MGSAEEAQKAIDTLNGKMVGDRNITVNVARPREERSSGGLRSGARASYGRRYEAVVRAVRRGADGPALFLL
jgi:RNA recognition motif-containing protein